MRLPVCVVMKKYYSVFDMAETVYGDMVLERKVMESVIVTIATSILSAALWEISKGVCSHIKVKREERTSTYNINGYWTSWHKSIDNFDGKEYESFELIKLKSRKGIVYILIYQIVNDGRKYMYRGNGLMQFDKLVVSYKEVTKNKSNFLGSIMVRFSNEIEHKVILRGRYHEFRRDSPNSKSYPYKLREYKLSGKEKIKIIFKGKRYIFQILEKDEFKDECRKKV